MNNLLQNSTYFIIWQIYKSFLYKKIFWRKLIFNKKKAPFKIRREPFNWDLRYFARLRSA